MDFKSKAQGVLIDGGIEFAHVGLSDDPAKAERGLHLVHTPTRETEAETLLHSAGIWTASLGSELYAIDLN